MRKRDWALAIGIGVAFVIISAIDNYMVMMAL